MGKLPRAQLARRAGARRPPAVRAAAWLLAAVALGCASRGAVTLTLTTPASVPADATVTIDELYVGRLETVVRRGVRLPVGVHRVSVEHEGWFPFDVEVVADRDDVALPVVMTPVPD